MIKTEAVELNGRTFLHTFSDANFFIERDGVKYEEAYDPIGTGRTYTETSEEIVLPVEEDTEATIDDYKEALTELGVNVDEEK